MHMGLAARCKVHILVSLEVEYSPSPAVTQRGKGGAMTEDEHILAAVLLLVAIWHYGVARWLMKLGQRRRKK